MPVQGAAQSSSTAAVNHPQLCHIVAQCPVQDVLDTDERFFDRQAMEIDFPDAACRGARKARWRRPERAHAIGRGVGLACRRTTARARRRRQRRQRAGLHQDRAPLHLHQHPTIVANVADDTLSEGTLDVGTWKKSIRSIAGHLLVSTELSIDNLSAWRRRRKGTSFGKGRAVVRHDRGWAESEKRLERQKQQPHIVQLPDDRQDVRNEIERGQHVQDRQDGQPLADERDGRLSQKPQREPRRVE